MLMNAEARKIAIDGKAFECGRRRSIGEDHGSWAAWDPGPSEWLQDRHRGAHRCASYVRPIRYDLPCPVLEAILATIHGGLNGIIGSSPPSLPSLAKYVNLTAMGASVVKFVFEFKYIRTYLSRDIRIRIFNFIFEYIRIFLI